MRSYDLSQSTLQHLRKTLNTTKLPEEKNYYQLELLKRRFYANCNTAERQNQNIEMCLDTVLFRSVQDNYFFNQRHKFILDFERFGIYKYYGINLIDFFKLDFFIARDLLNKAFINFDMEQKALKESIEKSKKEQAEINKLSSVSKKRRK